MNGTATYRWLLVGAVCVFSSGCDGSLAAREREPDPEPDVHEPADFDPSGSYPTQPEPSPDGPEDDPAPEPSALSTGFISEPDGGLTSFECDLYEADCNRGEKCTVWANDGGGAWNATKCVEVDPSPDLAGEECHVEGSGVSGIDSCEAGAFCWDTNTEGMGMCVPFCQGSENAPTCDNPHEAPAAGKTFCICLPTCDPLLNDCPVGCGCYGTDNRFQCVPDASGPDLGAFGDPCEFTNGCDPGLSCTSAEYVECEGTACCTYFCSLAKQDSCPGAHVCRSVFPEGQVLPDFEDVGLCLLPDEE